MHSESGTLMPAACANCDTPGTLQFCPQCGQRRPGGHEYDLGRFLHELLHELVNVDGKIARTLHQMLTAPGQLTLDHWAGRRARYLTPIRIYLLATAAFFALVRIAAAFQSSVASAPELATLVSRLPAE